MEQLPFPYTILENWMSCREHKRQQHISSLAQPFLQLILKQHKFSLLLMQAHAFKEGHEARESLLIPSDSICISQQIAQSKEAAAGCSSTAEQL